MFKSIAIACVITNTVWLSPAMATTLNTRIETAADSQLDPAVRLNPPVEQLNPQRLTGCDEMKWYREYVGLPAVFDGLGWRESNCKNNVRTYCCYGYWQEYIGLWLSTKSSYRDALINVCGISGVSDIYGLSDKSKLGQACAAKVVYDISKLAPWRQ